jgi:hypothetical protein
MQLVTWEQHLPSRQAWQAAERITPPASVSPAQLAAGGVPVSGLLLVSVGFVVGFVEGMPPSVSGLVVLLTVHALKMATPSDQAARREMAVILALVFMRRGPLLVT